MLINETQGKNDKTCKELFQHSSLNNSNNIYNISEAKTKKKLVPKKKNQNLIERD